MSMKHKITSLLLAASMLVGLAACGNDNGSSSTSDSSTSSESNTGTVANQIVIGNTTDPTGDVKAYWTNGALDASVNNLVHGYSTVALNNESEYIIDPVVVKEHSFTDNEDGTRTMTVTLNDNLKWSNGDPITAKDYVGGILLFSSPLIVETGATGDLGYYFEGYDAYNGTEGVATDEEGNLVVDENGNFLDANGNIVETAKEFSGVHLIDEYTFSVTMKAEYVPSFFELAYFSASPEYMKGWLPEDIDIADDGNGAYFTGDFTLDHVGETIEDMRWNLKAFSGPYVVESYDPTTLAYTLQINEEWLGNFEGQKPSIETIIYKKVLQETMMDELRTGSVDLLHGVADGATITEGLDMADEGLAQYLSYDRNGYGFISFVCDNGPTQFVEVRHAIAYLLDRNEFAKQFTQGFGSLVHGPYGTGMWMTAAASDTIASLNSYAYSLDNAIAELEAGGWTLDANGNEYSGTGVRYKDVNGTLMPLKINWACSENNSVSDMIATMLVENPDVTTAGFEFERTVMTFDEMLTGHYYNMEEDYYNMYNLASDFPSPVYDQNLAYQIGSTSNYSHIADEELATLAREMLLCDSSDNDAFLEKWSAFIARWNELLPALPLYSNQYFDFFSEKLQGYEGVSGYRGEYDALLYAYVEGAE